VKRKKTGRTQKGEETVIDYMLIKEELKEEVERLEVEDRPGPSSGNNITEEREREGKTGGKRDHTEEYGIRKEKTFRRKLGRNNEREVKEVIEKVKGKMRVVMEKES